MGKKVIAGRRETKNHDDVKETHFQRDYSGSKIEKKHFEQRRFQAEPRRSVAMTNRAKRN